MGGYISVLYKNYNIPVYNENQFADIFTFRRKGLYIGKAGEEGGWARTKIYQRRIGEK